MAGNKIEGAAMCRVGVGVVGEAIILVGKGFTARLPGAGAKRSAEHRDNRLRVVGACRKHTAVIEFPRGTLF